MDASSAPTPASPLEQTALELCTRLTNIPPAALNAGRAPCPDCKRKVQTYCGDCGCAVIPELQRHLVPLPLTLDVLRGAEEAGSKSTASHALVLAEPVRLFKLPDFPAYADPKRVLLLYPSPTSVSVSDLPDLGAYDYLAVVDTTWVKVGRVFQMPELIAQPLTHVHLGRYQTLFWRHQPLGPQFVSSIESVYFFFREWEIERRRRALLAAGTAPPPAAELGSLYDGRYDDLLLLFLHQHKRIQDEYKGDAGKSITRHVAAGLSSSAPQSIALAARQSRTAELSAAADEGEVQQDVYKEGESMNESKRKRLRVKAAWSVMPAALGREAASAAGDAARMQYVSMHFCKEGDGQPDAQTAAAMQFEHIRTSNAHVYGTLSLPGKEQAAEGKQAAQAVGQTRMRLREASSSAAGEGKREEQEEAGAAQSTT